VQDPTAALRTLRWDFAFELLEPAAHGAALETERRPVAEHLSPLFL